MKSLLTDIRTTIGAVTAVLVGMEPYYGHKLWFSAVIAGSGALLGYVATATSTTSSAAVDAAPKAEVSK